MARAGPGRTGSWHGDGTSPALAISLGLRPWFLTTRDQFVPPPPASGTVASGRPRDRARRDRRADARADPRHLGLGAKRGDALERDRRRHHRPRPPVRVRRRAKPHVPNMASRTRRSRAGRQLTYWYRAPPRPTRLSTCPCRCRTSPPISAHATLFSAGAAVLGRLGPDERDRSTAWPTWPRVTVWGGCTIRRQCRGARSSVSLAEAAIAVLAAETPRKRATPRRKTLGSPAPMRRRQDLGRRALGHALRAGGRRVVAIKAAETGASDAPPARGRALLASDTGNRALGASTDSRAVEPVLARRPRASRRPRRDAPPTELWVRTRTSC